MLTLLTALAMVADHQVRSDSLSENLRSQAITPDAGEIHACPDAGEIHAGEIHKAGDTCVDPKGVIWTYDGVIWSADGVIW